MDTFDLKKYLAEGQLYENEMDSLGDELADAIEDKFSKIKEDICNRVERVSEELKDVTKSIKEVGNQIGDVPKSFKGKPRTGRKPQ